MKVPIDCLWTVEETARFLRVPKATLYQWRYLGIGPKGGRVGRYLRYDPADVIAWFRQQQQEGRVSIYDRWHKAHPAPGDEPCHEHSKGRTKLYPTVSHGDGDRWQARWRDENGRQRKRNFARRDGADPDKHAAAFDAKIKREFDTGTSLDINAGQLKVRDYAAE